MDVRTFGTEFAVALRLKSVTNCYFVSMHTFAKYLQTLSTVAAKS